MDSPRLKELPKISSILMAVLIGAIVGIGLYKVYTPKNPLTGAPLEQNQIVVNEESAVINVVDKVSPSVVAIGINRLTLDQTNSTIGSGFVVSDKGIIATNKHVVANLNVTYTILAKEQGATSPKSYLVTKIYRDPFFDLALLQIEDSHLKPVEIGDSSKLKVGQTVVAIGNALGEFTNSVTTGIVSGLGRRVVAGDPFSGSSESLDNLIQTDAAINPGNSGGPLLNGSGQVIGVNVATTQGAQNIGFAIPINSVKRIVDDFVEDGVVSRPFLGIRYRFVAKDLALMNQVPQGAYIQEVVSGSSADKAGIQAGDIITKIDGQAVDSEGKISGTIATKKVGEKLQLSIWRDNSEKPVTATLQDAPSQ